MAIQLNDRVPATDFRLMTEDGPQSVASTDWFSGRRVVLFSVPGAFTPTCSAQHLPGFIEHAEDLRAQGIEAIGCTSVNDVFVMSAWGKSAGADGIDMLADGNGEFTAAVGLELDASSFGMGTRGQRFALVADDGVVTHLFIEAPGAYQVSSAEHVLASLQG
jgi:peroxiredoxin